MQPPWLNVSHVPQTAESDCLVACVSMVLDYLGQSQPYDRITQILQTRWFGTPARNILFLDKLGLKIVLEEQGLDEITTALEQGYPVIAFVNTAELPYWMEQTDHAVVVVGVDEREVYLNDPYFMDAPQRVSHSEFSLSQLRFDALCALIKMS
jgi:ABC-type bacteriocin/lantibiotic exporter with double-glycine peptidase domain